ncbi:MAG TPA: ABC transporter substrate-binding protein [Myxococcaceae bacterium]|nr:ABC transporter substrate-binding protein [Myxococcaceae bacterium]
MRLRLLALCALPLVFAAGCLDSNGDYFGRIVPKKEPVLVFNDETEPEYLDPNLLTGHPDARAADLMFEGLTEYHPRTLAPQPAVAERWEVGDDLMHFTFHLRKEARWSDGTPITAWDAVYSWERLLDPVTAGRYAQQLYFVKNAEAYNSGRAKEAQVDLVLRAEPRGDAPERGRLAAGTVVDVLDSNQKDSAGAPVTSTNRRRVRAAMPLRRSPDPNAEIVEQVTPADDLHLEDSLDQGKPGWVKVQWPSRDLYGWLPSDAVAYPDAGKHWLKVRAQGGGGAQGWAPAEVLPATYRVLGLRVDDPYTLEVTLHSPAAFFLYQTSHTAARLVPRQAIERFGPRWTRPENVVTNGAFHLVEHRVRDKMVFVKSDTYWGRDDVQLEKVIAYTLEDHHATANLYKAGDTDLIVSNELPNEYVAPLKGKKDMRINTRFSSYFYRLNVTRKPLNDKRVRQALSYALDRNEVVTALKVGHKPATGLVPPGIEGYTPAVGHEFNPAKARRLLAEAGYPDGKGFPPLAILYNTREDHKMVAAVVQENWRRNLGIEVTLENREWKTYLKDTHGMNYDIARYAWIGDYPDPNTFLEMFVTNGGNNETGWSSPAYDAKLAASARERDPAKRMQLLHELEEILNEEVPLIPIYWYAEWELVKPYVQGWDYNLIDKHVIHKVRLLLDTKYAQAGEK